ncbi:hypothetical protein P167DRAFT_543847 [Morchella conica CCBAS932]|uniref:Uncharacterized protein n=1 Tax=Morchella conica CCBAS932 TaxID=1392247 RepID=A0A3N4KUP9_9PEZI|nr:hypothetical protein P167DRAFT_543847 [Morchella conica CCBAS932]
MTIRAPSTNWPPRATGSPNNPQWHPNPPTHNTHDTHCGGKHGGGLVANIHTARPITSDHSDARFRLVRQPGLFCLTLGAQSSSGIRPRSIPCGVVSRDRMKKLSLSFLKDVYPHAHRTPHTKQQNSQKRKKNDWEWESFGPWWSEEERADYIQV